MKKTAKRILSLALCLVMMTGLLSVGASAEGKAFRYVALGDSTSMGYMLNDFNWSHNHSYREIGASAFATYSNMMGYLKDTWHIGSVEGVDLSLTGCRPMELRAILDREYYGLYCDGKQSTSLNYCDNHLDQYTSKRSKNESYDFLNEKYTEAIRNADLITYDLIMADTGTLLSALTGDVNSYGCSSTSELLKAEGCEAMAGTVEAFRSALEAFLGESAASLGNLIDALVCGYAADVINFSKSIDLIYKLNPDVNLIVVGPFNPFRGIVLDLGSGIELELGKLYGVAIDFLTSYMILDKNSWRYRFADCSGGVETLKEALAKGELEEYSAYVDTILSYCLGDTRQNYSAEQITEMKEVIQYVSTLEEFTIDELTSALSSTVDPGVKRALLRDDDVTEEDFRKLNAVIFMGMGHNAGTHPDKVGYQQKFEAIKRAFLSPVAANGAYLTRIIDDAVSVVNNIVGAVLGSKSSNSRIISAIKSVLTPVIRISLF